MNRSGRGLMVSMLGLATAVATASGLAACGGRVSGNNDLDAAAGSSGTGGDRNSATGGGGSGGTGGAGGGSAPHDDAAACVEGDAGADRQRSFIDLRITGVAFDEHNGSTIHLYTAGGPFADVYALGTQVIAGAGFVLDLPSAYKRRGPMQPIVWFIDADGDGTCNSANNDHSGYTTIGPFDPDPGADQRIDVTISDNHTNPFQGTGDPCSQATAPLLDLDITGSAFDAHEGQTIHLLTSSPNSYVVRAAGQATIHAGTFAFHFPKGFARSTYQEVFWFVDVDGDGRCTTGTDHTGYVATPAFNPSTAAPPPQRVTIMDNPTTTVRGQDVCAVMSGCRPPP